MWRGRVCRWRRLVRGMTASRREGGTGMGSSIEFSAVGQRRRTRQGVAFTRWKEVTGLGEDGRVFNVRWRSFQSVRSETESWASSAVEIPGPQERCKCGLEALSRAIILRLRPRCATIVFIGSTRKIGRHKATTYFRHQPEVIWLHVLT